MNLSDKELLNYALENGMIDVSTIQKTIEMNERKKYLEMHNHEVWQGKDGYFYTKVDDETKSGGRRMIKKSQRKAVEDAIVEHYKKSENDPDIRFVFEQCYSQKLRYGEIQRQTYDRYLTDFERFFGEIAEKKIRYISEENLEDFIKTSIREKGLTAKAWGNLRILINGIFKYAKKKGYSNLSITSFMGDLDISSKTFAKKRKSDEECVFKEEEIRKLSKYLLQKPTLGNLGVLLAAYTGMRVGEVAALKWEDINEKYIYVHRTQVRFHGESGEEVYEIRDSPKTDAGVRKVVVVEKLLPIIRKIRSINPFTEYVFEKKGSPLTKHAFEMCLYRACDAIGIPRRSMHVLRKTYATRLINSNVEESVIINQMGHTDISTTKGYYYYNDKTLDYMAESIGKVINY